VPSNVRELASSAGDVNMNGEIFHQRTLDILAASDSGIISLGNMAYNPKFRKTSRLNGLGGELLRGGYGKGLNKVKVKYDARSLLLSKWGRYKDLFNSEVVKEYEIWLDQWLENSPRPMSLLEAADFGYLYCRMGRWGASQTRTGALAGIPIYPILDNRLIAMAYKVPVEHRGNDRLLFEIMHRIAPALAKLPFANDYWAFQDENEIENLKKRYPEAFLPRRAKEAGENLDWRSNWIDYLGEYFYEHFFMNCHEELFQIVDRVKLKSLFDDGKLNYGHRFPLFGMYSASLLFEKARVS
jgi:hypothetical protein